MSYTVNELSTMKSTLNEATSVNNFLESLHINEVKFLSLLDELLENKIIQETKSRKKRIIKFIRQYMTTNDWIDSSIGIKEYLKEDDIYEIIRKLFNTKKSILTDETTAFYVKDFNEFFNMFAPNTPLTEIIQTCK